MPGSDVSVLTIAAGRAGHLANLVRGLARQSAPPAELVIAVMQFDRYTGLPPAPFPIRQIPVPTSASRPLVLVRNIAACAARGDLLVFLDADGIPAPDPVADHERAACPDRGVFMAEVLYLPEDAANRLDFALFERFGSVTRTGAAPWRAVSIPATIIGASGR